jgi:hypothetical protein
MDCVAAALRIQSWWRMISVRQLIVAQARQEFEELCQEFQDQRPIWSGTRLSLPEFAQSPPEVERLWIDHAIASRLAALKYDALVRKFPN